MPPSQLLPRSPSTNPQTLANAMHTRYDALIFDCDGTLADTMPGHYVSWRKTMSRYGISFTEERFYALGGVPTVKIIEMLAAEAGLTLDAAAVAQEKEQAFHEVSLASVKPVEPVVAIARQYRDKMPVAVATGSAGWAARVVLEHIGVLDWFQTLVAAEDTENHKPEPDVYLEAARRLKVDPTRCCAFEDTDMGLESARRAGMTAIDIRTMDEQALTT